MRVILASDAESIVPLWAKLNRNTITGCFFGAEHILRTPGVMPGLHFTYPPDGRLHYSLERQFAGYKIFETHFSDHCRVKIFNEETGARDELKRESHSADLSVLLPKDQLSLADIRGNRGWYTFPTLAIPVSNGRISTAIQSLGRHPRRAATAEDIYIDISKLPNSTLDISAAVYGANTRPSRFANATYVSSLAQRDGLFLEIFAFYFPAAA